MPLWEIRQDWSDFEPPGGEQKGCRGPVRSVTSAHSQSPVGQPLGGEDEACPCLDVFVSGTRATARTPRRQYRVVRDTSGAVLPGVTVEVASPALIEKVRTTVTDASGAYQIIQLLPGTYTATFTLPGFSTAKRDGIELGGSFVATINMEMRVGELAETIT